MKAIYTPELNCAACYDTSELFGGITATDCIHCQESNREEVTIVKVGQVNSVVASQDGTLKTVKTNRLKLIE